MAFFLCILYWIVNFNIIFLYFFNKSKKLNFNLSQFLFCVFLFCILTFISRPFINLVDIEKININKHNIFCSSYYYWFIDDLYVKEKEEKRINDNIKKIELQLLNNQADFTIYVDCETKYELKRMNEVFGLNSRIKLYNTSRIIPLDKYYFRVTGFEFILIGTLISINLIIIAIVGSNASSLEYHFKKTFLLSYFILFLNNSRILLECIFYFLYGLCKSFLYCSVYIFQTLFTGRFYEIDVNDLKRTEIFFYDLGIIIGFFLSLTFIISFLVVVVISVNNFINKRRNVPN